MADRASTKLFIPHPADPTIRIVGILERLMPHQSTHNRRIALILHGTMGHKDYLFQKRLALMLPLDSFRFDFRGNHETGGTWKQGALADDIEDIQIVVDYLKLFYGYSVDLIVGHSRGSIAAFRWLCSSQDGPKVSGFVNASGRYRMAKILESPVGTLWKEEIERSGFYTWKVTVARKEIEAKIYAEDLQNFVSWDTSIVWNQFPQGTDVLTLHGLSDKTVPPYDALIYASALNERNPGTHTLHLMEDADHNFTGRQDDVVDVILQWWAKRENQEIKTGIWVGDIKGKL